MISRCLYVLIWAVFSRGIPFVIVIGKGTVIKGLDEGMLRFSMCPWSILIGQSAVRQLSLGQQADVLIPANLVRSSSNDLSVNDNTTGLRGSWMAPYNPTRLDTQISGRGAGDCSRLAELDLSILPPSYLPFVLVVVCLCSHFSLQAVKLLSTYVQCGILPSYKEICRVRSIEACGAALIKEHDPDININVDWAGWSLGSADYLIISFHERFQPSR